MTKITVTVLFNPYKKEENKNEDKFLTVDRCFARKDDHNQLQTNIRHLKVFKHGLHTISSLGIFTETRLALNGHPSILRNFSQLVSEAPVKTQEFIINQLGCMIRHKSLAGESFNLISHTLRC